MLMFNLLASCHEKKILCRLKISFHYVDFKMKWILYRSRLERSVKTETEIPAISYWFYDALKPKILG